ncbi:hypothetical protein AB835_05470 [Candidatus Endobugula sertula]|uniref:Fatty acid desaturase domain-containing protein n=1 Tax=Candidatus Endobugula sertula TaxID=62101 RepID=A0A1D2QRA9_9GAMM|nr:hypothetical protein AB835_05470 [Candidatus Endobugula sertula]
MYFFTINSTGHLKSAIVGYRNYETSDNSKNLALFVLLSFGACWHNNHHRFTSSATTQRRWWELDCGYLILRLLAAFSICWDLKQPPSVSDQCVYSSK